MEQNNEYFMERLADSDALLADGFEDALIGVTEGMRCVAVYDYKKCLEVLMKRDGMTYSDAIEYMDYNVTGAYVCEMTPVFITMDEL
jgi:hypothetical protein